MIRGSLPTLVLTSLVGLVGLVGCSNLTKPDDIVVAPDPRRPTAAAAPSPSGAPQVVPVPRPGAPPPG